MPKVCLFTATCLAVASAAWGGGWVLETVTGKDNGEGCSLAVDNDGNPHVIYINRELREDQLMYAYRENGTWQFRTVDNDLMLLTETAVTLDPYDFVYCAYLDSDSGNLYCSYEDLQGWHTETVASSTSGKYGVNLSFAQWPNGQNRLAYDYVTQVSSRVYYAVKTGGSWQAETVTSAGNPGACTVLIVDYQQVPHLFFAASGEEDAREVLHAEKDGDEWTLEKVGDGSDCDAYLTPDGKFHVAYAASDNTILNYAAYDGQSWEAEIVENVSGSPAVPQICVAPNGDVYITYYDFDKLNLHIMKKDATKWTHRVLASGSFSGFMHSMDIGNADYPQVVFYNAGTARLRWAYYDESLGVDVASFTATRRDGAVDVRWTVTDEAGIAGYNLYRDSADAGRVPVNSSLITGASPLRYRDAAARPAESYDYWLEAVLLSGSTEEFGPASVPPAACAKAISLYQNSPNPASGATTFSFELPAAAAVTLAVYDAAGRKVATVADGYFAAGRHDLPFETSLPAGVYLYRLETADETHSKKMVVAPH